MNEELESRVVSLDFDNSRFASGIQSTLKLVNQFTGKMDTAGAHAFDGLDKAVKKIDISPLSNAFDVLTDKSAWATTTALNCMVRLENRVLEFAKKVTNALTIQPIMTGFNTYEARLEATQTIMSATGESLDKVNEKINELNRYSDDTIYSFKDMTTNIGKFTNAGVSLDDSVQAIMGVSNAAAIAGANANEASRAMYNLAQSLAMGYVQYIDWKSIENANMATKQFKQHIADVGVAMGTVTKINEDCYEVAGKQYNLQGLFKDALKDQWLTSETLIKVLKEYADTETEVGKKGFAAAKDIKTFTQMMETLSEGAASKWATTFQLIIGDLTEAKVMLKQVAAPIDEMIAQSAEFRNGMLSQAFTDGFAELKDTIDAAGLSNDEFEKELIRHARLEGVHIDSLIKKYDNLKGVITAGGIPKELISDVLKNMAKTAEDTEVTFDEEIKRINSFNDAINHVKRLHLTTAYEEQKALTEELSKAGFDYASTQSLVTKVLKGEKVSMEELSVAELSSLKFTDEQIKKISKYQLSLGDTTERIDTLTKMMGRANARFLWLDTLRSALDTLKNITNAAQTAFTQVFGVKLPDSFEKALDKVHGFVTGLELTQEKIDKLTKAFKGFFLIIDSVGYVIKSTFNFILKIVKTVLPSFNISLFDTAAKFGDLGQKVNDFVRNTHPLEMAFNKIEPYLKKVPGYIGTAIEKLKVFGKSGKDFLDQFIAGMEGNKSTFMGKIGNLFRQVVDTIKNIFKTGFSLAGKDSIGGDIAGGLKDAFLFAKKAIEGVIDTIASFFSSSSGNGKKLATAAKDIDYGLIARLGLFGLMLKKLMQAFFDLKGTFKSTTTMLGSALNFIKSTQSMFTSIKLGIDKVTRTVALKNLAQSVNELGQTIQSIALSVVFIAIACRLLSKCSWNDIAKAGTILIVVSGLLVGMIVCLATIDKEMGNKFSFKGINMILTSGVLGVLGAVILELTACIAILALLTAKHPMAMTAAFGMISALIIELGGIAVAIIALTKTSNPLSIATGAAVIAALGAAILPVVASVVILGKLPLRELIQGGAAVAIIMAVLGAIAVGVVALAKKITVAAPAIAAVSILIGSLGTAMLEIAIACKIMGEVSLESVGKAVLMLTYIAALGAAMAALTKAVGWGAASAGLLILAFSSSLLLMALGVKAIGALSEEEIAKGIIVMTVLAGVFSIMMLFAKGASKFSMTKIGKDVMTDKSGPGGFLGMFIGFAAACLILAIAIGKLAAYSPEQIAVGLGVIIVLAGIFDVMLLCSKGMAKAGKGSALAILSLVGSVALLAFAAKKIGELDVATLTKGVAAIAVLSLMVERIIKMSRRLSGTKGVASSILAISVMLISIGACLAIVSQFKGGDLLGATLAIGALLAIVTVCIKFFAKNTIHNNTLKSIGMMSLMVVACGAAIAAVCAFGKDGKEALAAAGAIAAVILSLGVVSVLVNKFATGNGGFVKGIIVLGILAGFMIALGYAFSLMVGMDCDQMLTAAEALEKVMIGLGALAAACAVIGAIGPEAFIGVGVIAALLVAIGAIGFLAAWATMKFIISHEKDISKIGEIFKDFGDKIKPLSESMTNLDSDSLKGLVSLMETFCDMSTMKFGDDNIQGISTLTEFSQFLPTLAHSMVEFSNILTDGNFNTENVKAASACGEMIAKLWNSLPKEGGKWQDFFGTTQDLSTFTSKLKPLGEAVVAFATSVNGENIDYETAEKAAGVAQVIAKLATGLPATGGRLEEWFGTKMDLNTFGNQLWQFGRACRFFAEGVRGYNEVAPDYDMATKAAEMGNAIAKLQESLPSTGGRLQEWFGTKMDLVTFGNQLWQFGRGVRFFAEGIRGYGEIPDYNLADSAANIGLTLAKLETHLPTYGGKLQTWFGTKQDLSTFGTQLGTFGDELATALRKWTNIEASDEQITRCEKVAEFCATLEKDLPSLDGKLTGWFSKKQSLGEFANNLGPLGNGISAFMENIQGINVVDALTIQQAMLGFDEFATNVTSADISYIAGIPNEDIKKCHDNVVECAKMLVDFQAAIGDANTYSMASATTSLRNLVDMASSIDNESFGGLASFKTGMQNIGSDSIANFCSVFENADYQVTSSFGVFNDCVLGAMDQNLVAWESVGSTLISQFLRGINSKINDTKEAGKKVARESRNGFNEDSINWFVCGQNFDNGLIRGIEAERWRVVATVRRLGELCNITLKQVLDEHSPSKITEGMGEFYVDGLTNGIENRYGNAAKVTTTLGNTLIDGMKAAMDSVNDMMNNVGEDGVVIKPVVDLTDVQKAAGNVRDIFDNTPVFGAISNISSNYGTNSSKYASLLDSLSGLETGVTTNNNYTVNGITYDDGTNVATAVESLIDAAQIRRRT